MNNIDIIKDSEITDKDDDKLIQRRISIYALHCEGRRYDEIASHCNVSKSTVYNDINWCRDNFSNDFPEGTFIDILFDTVRRRGILWTRFKKLSKVDFSTLHLVNISKHIMDLDKKILEWKSIARQKLNVAHTLDTDNLDDILKKLDECLRNKSDKEIEELLAKEMETGEKYNKRLLR